MKIVKQWKQDVNGKVTEDKSHIVISLSGERTIIIQWCPFRISYHSFCGCA